MLPRCRCARTVGSWDHCLKKDVTEMYVCEDSWVMGPLLEEGCYRDVGVRGQLGHGTTA